MTKKARWWIIGVVTAVVLALSIGAVTLAAGPVNNANAYGCGVQLGTCYDVLSKLTGLTTDEIQVLRQEGKSLVQIAATKNVTEAQLVAAILADRKAVLQERVTAGTLTQAQVDLMLKNMEQNIAQMVNSTSNGQTCHGAGAATGNGICGGAGSGGTQNAAGGGCGGAGRGFGAGMMRGFGRVQ